MVNQQKGVQQETAYTNREFRRLGVAFVYTGSFNGSSIPCYCTARTSYGPSVT